MNQQSAYSNEVLADRAESANSDLSQASERRKAACFKSCIGISTPFLEADKLRRFIHLTAKVAGTVAATDSERAQARDELCGMLSMMSGPQD